MWRRERNFISQWNVWYFPSTLILGVFFLFYFIVLYHSLPLFCCLSSKFAPPHWFGEPISPTNVGVVLDIWDNGAAVRCFVLRIGGNYLGLLLIKEMVPRNEILVEMSLMLMISIITRSRHAFSLISIDMERMEIVPSPSFLTSRARKCVEIKKLDNLDPFVHDPSPSRPMSCHPHNLNPQLVLSPATTACDPLRPPPSGNPLGDPCGRQCSVFKFFSSIKIYVILLLLKITLIFVYNEFWIFVYADYKLLRFNFFNEFFILGRIRNDDHCRPCR